MGQIRIISGKWKGKKLTIAAVPGLRPSSDRIRETVFNWLQWQIASSYCLDLFAGSGVFGIEAVSRGANYARLVEKHPVVARNLRQQLTILNSTNLELIQADALDYIQIPAIQQFDVVFLDPPFRQNLLAVTCEYLEQYQWLTESAYIYVEMEAELMIKFPPTWQLLKDKRSGQIRYCLLQKIN
jgi:16S rRNA (guanine966-N2)-methyltransferase